MPLLLLLLAAPVGAVVRHVSTGGSDGGNDCTDSALPCATLQHAVDQALPGDVILVAPGVYNQTLRIRNQQDLTINALGATLRPDLATVGSADSEQGSTCSGSPGRSIVLVRDSTGIVFNGLSIDGSAAFMAPGETARWAGIYYRQSSGTIFGGSVTHLRTEPLSGNQVAGIGIVVQTEPQGIDPPPAVDIVGVSITDFQKTGILITGCNCAAGYGPTGSVRGVSVVSEPTGLLARNGIQVSLGARGVRLESNVASGMRFTGNPAAGLGSAIILVSTRDNELLRNRALDSNFGIVNIGILDPVCVPRAQENLRNVFRCNEILNNETGMSIDNDTSVIQENSFAGNTAVPPTGAALFTRSYYQGADADATFNWWGSPTGPTNPANPGGTGDVVDDRVDFTPFLTAPPLCANNSIDEIPTLPPAGLIALGALLAGAAWVLLRRQAPGSAG
ncbi:MAG TPA: IPTL-CTERM sorting domain-containing protein [Thermoanaerobaculia bacterium]|nr:IPTL-CTERM sorting domain-containing protein [Thermoanaerobaculia bacterium]